MYLVVPVLPTSVSFLKTAYPAARLDADHESDTLDEEVPTTWSPVGVSGPFGPFAALSPPAAAGERATTRSAITPTSAAE